MNGKYPDSFISADEIAPVILHNPQKNYQSGTKGKQSYDPFKYLNSPLVVMREGQLDLPGSHIGQHSPLISYSALLQVGTQSTMFMMRRSSIANR